MREAVLYFRSEDWISVVGAWYYDLVLLQCTTLMCGKEKMCKPNADQGFQFREILEDFICFLLFLGPLLFLQSVFQKVVI